MCSILVVFVFMLRRTPRSTRSDTLCPYTTLSDLLDGAKTLGVSLQRNIIRPFLSHLESLAGAGGEVTRSNLLNEFDRSEEHTSELQSLMRISYAVCCLKKKIITIIIHVDIRN